MRGRGGPDEDVVLSEAVGKEGVERSAWYVACGSSGAVEEGSVEVED